ncbi:MAG: ferritin-like domain-containing protein, partial [Acidimicrobiales bacterium]
GPPRARGSGEVTRGFDPGRRAVLAAGPATAAGLVLGACGGDDNPRPVDPTIVNDPNRLEGDLAVAALLASLDNLLVTTYQEGIDRRDRLGGYPPAVLTVLETAQRQHREHAAAWNGILTGAGKPAVTGLNQTVKTATTDPQFFRAATMNAALTICHDIENVTALTYLAAIGGMNNNAAIRVAASIYPVQSQHVAVLTLLLGRAMPPDAFSRSDGVARTVSDAIS